MQAAEQARYGRQLLLSGVGEAGQRRVIAGVARVAGEGLRHEIAMRYATRAGFGTVAAGTIDVDDEAPVTHAAAAAVLAGSRAALVAFRRTAVDGERA